MDFIHIFILSIIQGVTEFLPISSQSHLILTSYLLGLKDQGLGFDIALHFGSLIAILIYYRKEIRSLLSLNEEGANYLKLIIIGSIPLPIIGLLFIDTVSQNMRSILSIASMTILFAVILYLADTKKKEVITKFANISIILSDSRQILLFFESLREIPTKDIWQPKGKMKCTTWEKV